MLKALQASTPLDGRSITIDNTSLWVVSGRPLYSLSVPLGNYAAFETALSTSLSLTRPAAGQYHDADAFRLCGLAQDQFFLMGLKAETPDERALKSRLQDAAYVTDQSDSMFEQDDTARFYMCKMTQPPCWTRGATCGCGTTCNSCCNGAHCPWYQFGVGNCK